MNTGPRSARTAGPALFAAAPPGDPRTPAARAASAERLADSRAWRALPLYLLAAIVISAMATVVLGDRGAAIWFGLTMLLAFVSWRRRMTPVDASRIRLALAWGAIWGAMALRLAESASAAPVLGLQLAALGATALLWSRPSLLAAHLVLAVTPGVAVLAIAGHWSSAAMLALTALTAIVAGVHLKRLHTHGARAAGARDEAEALAAELTALNNAATADHDVLLDASEDATLIADTDGRIVMLNDTARLMTGARPGDRIRDVVPLIEADTRRRVSDPVTQCQRLGHAVHIGDCILLADGQARECRVNVHAGPLSGERVLLRLRDRSEIHALENLQKLQSALDPVTGLLNRRELERRYRRVLESAPEATHALCCLEVDQVGLVNEACGYPAGDSLLHQVALQLAAAARSDDIVARLGGGQFALLLPRSDAQAARIVADKLLDSLRATPFPWGEQHFALTGSVGIATFSGADTPLADVLAAAVSACHAARDADTDRVHLYRDDDAALSRFADLRNWMQRVQHAVETGGFELLAHDIVPVRGNRQQRHAELLMRMRGDDGGLIAPGVFLGAAQRLKLMPAIDRWVIRNALQVMSRPDGPLSGYGFCAINLSGQSLSDPELLVYIEDCLRETGVAPRRVCFEITESDVIADLPVAQTLMRTLRERGCQFALDDFGTGLSSYAYLKELPADLVKIDGAFVRGLVADTTDRGVVDSINQVAHLVGMRTIAEYVQDAATLAALEQLGVDYAQGSVFGDPRPVV